MGEGFEFTGEFDMDFLRPHEAVRKAAHGPVQIIDEDLSAVLAEFEVGDYVKRTPEGIAVYRPVVAGQGDNR